MYTGLFPLSAQVFALRTGIQASTMLTKSTTSFTLLGFRFHRSPLIISNCRRRPRAGADVLQSVGVLAPDVICRDGRRAPRRVSCGGDSIRRTVAGNLRVTADPRDL